MSDIQRLEQKIDKQNDQMNGKMDKLIETMTTFVAFQARAEERHANNNKRLDKLEELVAKLWDMVHKNSLIVNGAVGVGCLVIGAGISWALGG